MKTPNTAAIQAFQYKARLHTEMKPLNQLSFQQRRHYVLPKEENKNEYEAQRKDFTLSYTILFVCFLIFFFLVFLSTLLAFHLICLCGEWFICFLFFFISYCWWSNNCSVVVVVVDVVVVVFFHYSLHL